MLCGIRITESLHHRDLQRSCSIHNLSRSVIGAWAGQKGRNEGWHTGMKQTHKLRVMANQAWWGLLEEKEREQAARDGRSGGSYTPRKRRRARARALPDAEGRGFRMRACRLVFHRA